MKRKQLTALLLSAAMVLTNAGISFGALDGPEDVGKRGEVEVGKEAWITLNANGGMFRFAGSEDPDTPGVSTPSDATPSDASKAAAGEETSTTLDVGGPVTTADKDGYYYLLFEDAEPAAESAVSGWDVLTQGPETKNGEMEFAGWYAKKDDLTTKLEPGSKLYGHADVYARWVSGSQATVNDDVKAQVVGVKVSGLAEGSKLTFTALDDTKQKDVQKLTEIVDKRALTDLGVSSVELSKDENALVQLDISVDQTTKGPVGITMKDPFDGKYDKVLVIHLNDAATEALDVQYAVLDGENISFMAKGFSPYILAAVENVTTMAKVKVENVKNGALIVYSDIPVTGGVKRTFVPIGEEVEIPVGTELRVEYQGAYVDGVSWRPKNNRFQVKSGETTEDIRCYSTYKVEGDAVISAEFAENAGEGLEVIPQRIPTPAVYEGTVSYCEIEEDGTKKNYEVLLDEERTSPNDNALFTLKDGVLKSKDTLKLGEYILDVKWETENGISYTEFIITVGDIWIKAESNNIPKPDTFSALLQVYLNDEKVDHSKWSLELDSEDEDSKMFSLQNYALKSKEVLPLGDYYPRILVKTPEGRSYKDGVSVSVGVSGSFSVSLAKYERNNSHGSYSVNIADYLKRVYLEDGATFKDAEKQMFEELASDWSKIKEIAMYGHLFKGWADMDGKIVEDTQKLERNNNFYAVFEGYTPVKVETAGSTVKPEDPEEPSKPGKPDKPGNSDNSSSRDEDYSSGSSSSGGKGSSTEANTISGNWQKDAKGWWFQMANGGYARNQWGKVNNVWYYFNNEGYMATGWQQVDGRWYYLSEAEANLGTLIVGWHFDSNYQKWFYLNSSGIMLTGWQQIDGNWYYLNMSSDGIHGAMAANTTVDGYYINANGVRAQ